jgi:hypothetical protein
MSRNRRWKLDSVQCAKTTASGAGDEFLKFLRGRDPDVMGPFLVALNKSRSLFSWLTPGARVIGVPDWAGEDLPWVTLVDDLHAAARGPTSFDQPSLKWWTVGASLLVVDAATPTARLYEAFGSWVAKGYLMLLVQTVEARRLQWQEYFGSVRSADEPAVVMHLLKSNRPGGPKHVLRTGRLGDDFVSDRPCPPNQVRKADPPE